LFITKFFFYSSSVEHQIADIKQRLNHIEHLSLEHQTEYKNFEENLQLFQLNINTFKQTLPTRLMQITIEDIRTIDVSLVFIEDIQRHLKRKRFSNRRFTDNARALFWIIKMKIAHRLIGCFLISLVHQQI
jgi:hypothetical protein